MDDKRTEKTIPLPVLRGGSIGDTLSGFPERIGHDERMGRRIERRVTMLFADLRGWKKVAERAGNETASALCQQVVDRLLAIVSEFGGSDVTVSGDPTKPQVSAVFGGGDHAVRALHAAWSMRETALNSLHSAFGKDRFQICIGLNSGTVSDTRVAGSGLSFRASGTVRMFTTRLREFAGPGQVFISGETYEQVSDMVRVRSIGTVRTNPDGDKSPAYCVMSLVDD